MLTFISRAQLSDWLVKSDQTLKGFFEKLQSVHKGVALSKQKPTIGTRCVEWVHSLYFNHHKSLAAVLTSVIMISLALRWRLAHKSRETVRLCHYHFHCHSHSNSVLHAVFMVVTALLWVLAKQIRCAAFLSLEVMEYQSVHFCLLQVGVKNIRRAASLNDNPIFLQVRKCCLWS